MLLLVAGSAAAQAETADDAPSAFGAAGVIADDQLGAIAGRANLNLLSQSDQAATVSQSSVSGTSTTGDIAIDGQAFQNLSGFAMLNANTGNNVAMNSSMNVSIAISPINP
jgi:hypothetical protein